MRCVSEIFEHHDFLREKQIKNEAGVRYFLGNMIADMLCRHFGYKLTLEQSDYNNKDALSTSAGSKYDYVVWQLMLTAQGRDTAAPVLVLETKHEKEFNSKQLHKQLLIILMQEEGLIIFQELLCC